MSCPDRRGPPRQAASERCRGDRLRPTKLRVQSVPHPTAEEVEGQHHYRDRQAPEEGQRPGLASACAARTRRLAEDLAAYLSAYLAMAHHGKVRLSIRSLPSGNRSPDHKHPLGFPMDGKDPLPAADLGGDLTVPRTEFDLSIAHMGITKDGEGSWLERALALSDRLGLVAEQKDPAARGC